MELDDLKQAWQQQTPEDIDVRNDKKIIDMIQNKSYGPLASLKARYERQFILIAILYAYIVCDIIMNTQKWERVFHDKSFLIFIITLLPVGWIIKIIQFRSYRMINKIQTSAVPLKSEIEGKLAYIEKGIKMQRWFGIAAGCFMLVFMEVLMYSHPEKDWGFMKDISVYLRILIYAGYTALIYFITKYTYYRQFGKHIAYLKDMLRKME